MPKPVDWSVYNQRRVQFRANKGLPATDGLLARTPSESGDLSATALRDLERYYALLARGVPQFSRNEAMLLADVLNGTLSEPHTMGLLWAEVDDAIRYDGIDRKWGVQGADLIDTLRSLSLAECYAIVDVIERAWLQPERDVAEVLTELGLIASEAA